jgi:hypothetical protein
VAITGILLLIFVLAVVVGVLYFRKVPMETFPQVKKINWKQPDNLITVISIPIEFLQLCVFSLSFKAEWSSKIYEGTSVVVFHFPSIPGQAKIAIFWVVSIIAIIWSICLFPLLVSFKGEILYKRISQIGLFSGLYSVTAITIPFIPIFAIPFNKTLLSMVECLYFNGTFPHGPVLAQDHSIICWKGNHIPLAVDALLVFCLFFPLAVFAIPRLQKLSLGTSKQIYWNTR